MYCMNKKIDSRFLSRLFWIAILCGIWEAIVRLGFVDPLLMPSILDIIKSLVMSIISGEIVTNILYSLNLIFISLIAIECLLL